MADFWRIMLSVIVGTAVYAPWVYIVLGGAAIFGVWKVRREFDDEKRTGRITLFWVAGVFLVWVFVIGEPYLSAKVAGETLGTR